MKHLPIFGSPGARAEVATKSRPRYRRLVWLAAWFAGGYPKPSGHRDATPVSPSVPAPMLALAKGQRELRLDLFRGLALWLIYIDHLSPDLLTWATIRNYGFSDAA